MRAERGQAAIEMGMIMFCLVLLTAGTIDFSRCFYQYNMVQAAAGYGARWGSVVGGLCGSPEGASTTDWCNQEGGVSGAFWSQNGNAPLQGAGVTCPSSYSSSFTGYYTVGNFMTGQATSIVGALARHYDTSSDSWNFIHGQFVPGFDLSKLKVCIQLTWDTGTSRWSSMPGDKLGVFIYYPYQPATFLAALHQINLVASGEYRID